MNNKQEEAVWHAWHDDGRSIGVMAVTSREAIEKGMDYFNESDINKIMVNCPDDPERE